MSERRTPTSTYRLQLHADFDFDAAARAVPYLSSLGISHLYLSPILQAAPGSTHGYDVVDHSRVSIELGGEARLSALAEQAHSHGMGIVVDLVPNHMALPTPLHLNRRLWETLRDGQESPSAVWFDVDWQLCGGAIGLPLLDSSLSDALAAGDLKLDRSDDEEVVRYGDQLFPVAAGTGQGSVVDVLGRQHYQLADWRDKAGVLGYRRFFDVDTLIAVRVELPEVFDATHAVPVDLYRRGLVDGFRIDHPDGLADPEGYLDRLRDATGGAWVVVEKILVGGERLPARWATAGTTGYDALNAIQSALAPPTGSELDRRWRSVDRGPASLGETELDAKRLVVSDLFGPEVARLTRRAFEAASDSGLAVERDDIEAAIKVLLSHVDRYRAYARLDVPPDQTTLGEIAELRRRAVADSPHLEHVLGILCELVLATTTTSEPGRDLVVRFQQVCGPVMAKGVEDTTFYQWHRFAALNEVGGDPTTLDDASTSELHAWSVEQHADHPHGLTALSTHDTKRDEDVRGRLLAAGEQVVGWDRVWDLVASEASAHDVDLPTAYLVMQTLVGAWPISGRRLSDYLTKAVREAKLHTTWVSPDSAYESQVADLAGACTDPGPVADAVEAWVAALSDATMATTLGAKLLQLTLPGIPDVYQGCERVQRYLVDPDNRRTINFAANAGALESLDAEAAPMPHSLDSAKLWLTSRVLRLRRDRPELFDERAPYDPVDTGSPHVVGFKRGADIVTLATRWPLTLAAGPVNLGELALADGEWTDALTSAHYSSGPVSLERVFQPLPVALLVRSSR